MVVIKEKVGEILLVRHDGLNHKIATAEVKEVSCPPSETYEDWANKLTN